MGHLVLNVVEAGQKAKERHFFKKSNAFNAILQLLDLDWEVQKLIQESLAYDGCLPGPVELPSGIVPLLFRTICSLTPQVFDFCLRHAAMLCV